MLQNYILDHVGIAVTNIDKSIDTYVRDFGFTVESRETLSDRKVEIAFLQLANTKLELLTPTNPADDTPIAKFLHDHGEGLHHLCYEVQDIRTEMSRLEGLGYDLIDKEPRPGAYGTIIAFLHPKKISGHVLTELCEYI